MGISLSVPIKCLRIKAYRHHSSTTTPLSGKHYSGLPLKCEGISTFNELGCPLCLCPMREREGLFVKHIHAHTYLYTCVCVYESEVARSCPTLCHSMDCRSPGSSVHGVFQVRILEWVAISFSRGSSQLRDRTLVSCTAGRLFTVWASRKYTHTHTHTHTHMSQTCTRHYVCVCSLCIFHICDIYIPYIYGIHIFHICDICISHIHICDIYVCIYI